MEVFYSDKGHHHNHNQQQLLQNQLHDLVIRFRSRLGR